MNTLLWVLVGAVIYTAVVSALDARGYLPSALRVQGPLTTLHTKRGRVLLDRLSRPKRLWRAYTNVGLGVTLVIMAGIFVALLLQGLAILRDPPAPTAVNQPRNFLVIPGVNDFLPLSVAPEIVFGLLVGLVVHEGGHGLLCRVEDIEVESMGLVFLTLIPIGAFVQPDEESQRRADRGGRTRMFAAGVTNNFAVTIVAFALLFGPVIGAIGVAPGLAVDGAPAGSPAAEAGIDPGDRITAVAGQPVDSEADLRDRLAAAGDPTVAVELNGESTVSVDRRLIVQGAIDGNPANLSVDPDEEPIAVTAVDGTPVRTAAGFRDAVADRPVATLSTSAGDRTIPVGAYVTEVTDGGPLDEATSLDGPLVITSLDGRRVVDHRDLGAALDATEPGDTVPLVAYVDGERRTAEVTLTAGPDGSDDGGFLGVRFFRGSSGLLLTDFGVEPYPAGLYLELLGGDGGPNAELPPGLAGTVESPLGAVWLSLVLPLASVIFGVPNFPGFTPAVTNFYVVSGPLAALGGAAFLVANLLFWTAWINLQLGIFNCIPGYPLDGGRILRTASEAVVSRLPVSDGYRVVRTITTGVGLTMLASLLLLVFGPMLLGG